MTGRLGHGPDRNGNRASRRRRPCRKLPLAMAFFTILVAVTALAFALHNGTGRGGFCPSSPPSPCCSRRQVSAFCPHRRHRAGAGMGRAIAQAQSPGKLRLGLTGDPRRRGESNARHNSAVSLLPRNRPVIKFSHSGLSELSQGSRLLKRLLS